MKKIQNVLPTNSQQPILLATNDGRKVPQYAAALAASFSAFATGTVLAWTAQISPRLLNGAYGFPINEDQLGWIGALTPLGASILALFVGFACDLIGRKATMLVLIIPITVGWALLLWATNVAMLYAGRFLTGMVAGAFCVTAPLYSNEISQKEIRGALGCFTQLMISFGILFNVIISKFVTIFSFTICCGLVPIVFGAIFVFMPESPVYYLKKDKVQEAKSALSWLRGKDYDVSGEISEITAALKEEDRGNILSVFRESFKKRATKMAFIVSIGLMTFRVLCGVDALTSYNSYIFENMDGDFDPGIGTIILISLQTTTAIGQSLVVDRIGRRILLLTSETLMAICITIVGVSVLLKERQIIEEQHYVYVNYLPLIALSVFYVGYSLGVSSISFMMNAEVNPQEVRSIVVSFNTFVSWMLAFVVTKTFIVIKESSGADVAFFLYGGLSFIGTAFIFFVVPETKGKSSEEIQNMLGKKR